MTVDWLIGDALQTAQGLPDSSVDLVATSPPFLALRDYGGIDGQWGSEPTPADFLDSLLTLATEFRRVLTPHGSIAVELGDTYSGSGGAGGDYNVRGWRDGQPKFSGSALSYRKSTVRNRDLNQWPLAKSLCGIPTLFAWSLAYGHNLLNPAHEFDPWRIRNVIVWARNNPAPGALADKVRPATSYITVATVSDKRWFDLDAVRTEAVTGDRVMRQTTPTFDPRRRRGQATHGERMQTNNQAGAPPTDYWTDEHNDGDLTWLVNTQGSGLAHYAMWPPKLAERLVLSMCPAEVCRECGEPKRRITIKERYGRPGGGRDRDRQGRGRTQRVQAGWESTDTTTIGWSDCGHNNYRPGVTLDPFCGTGTTLAVADLHGRDAIGIDLDPNNQDLYSARYAEVKKSLFGVDPPIEGQLDLLECGP